LERQHVKLCIAIAEPVRNTAGNFAEERSSAMKNAPEKFRRAFDPCGLTAGLVISSGK